MANEFKSGFVTFIGRPNVGKSTLMNRLIGQKIQTVYTDERGQIIFLDTPGINKAKNKLGNYMLQVAERTLNEVDVVLWLVEPSTFIGGGEKYIIEQLSKIKTPIILVINKIDTVEEKDILEAIDTDDVIDSIHKYLDEGPMYFDEDTITDQPERQICAELIREKALRLLSQEIPHGIAVVIDAMKVRRHGHIVDIDATIVCERDSHKGIIIGKQGSMLKKIGTQARIEMENLLDMKVNLQLWVKVKKDWRDSDMLLKNYGYDKKEV